MKLSTVNTCTQIYCNKYRKTKLAPISKSGEFTFELLGGTDDQEDVPAPPCESYDPETNTWREIAAPPGCSKQHAGAVCGEKIYISGGLDWDLVLSSVWCYDISFNTWSNKSDLLLPRADHSMGAHMGKLYVAGGWRDHAVTGNRMIVDTLDRYSPETDQWETISTVPDPTYHSSMSVLGHCLYVIGGLQHSGFNGASRKIIVYSIEKNKWCDKNYPVEIWEHQSCVLFVPVDPLLSQIKEQSNNFETSC